MRAVILAAAIAGAAACAFSSEACMVEDQNAQWNWWATTKSMSPLGPDFVRQNFYMGTGLYSNPFNPNNDPANCACAMGFKSPFIAQWVASGLMSNPTVGVFGWDGPGGADGFLGTPTSEIAPFSEMPFSTSVSAQVTDWWEAQSPGSGIYWFGFAGIVPAFIAPNGKVAVCFSFDIHVSIDALFKKNGMWACFAAGEADADLNPIFDPGADHPFTPIWGAEIPAPAAIACLLPLALGSRRRRSA
ncbi:MAG TPA: hypothetical protein PKC43_00890 [Phycisphaerales bacterium]|nr:hypothetical protein [Phycisphaerales bacterium]HMP35982.1 hypothetical protein [Phycisphaerales bacterium]